MNKFPTTRPELILLCMVTVLAIFVAGCAASHHAYLVPAPTANLSNGGHAATATADGVSVTVTPNVWDGRPYDLYRHVTPLKVRIENHSDRPLRLVYEDFKLETPQGETFSALPPSEIDGGQYVGENRMPQGIHFVDAAYEPQEHREEEHHRRVIISPGFAWNSFYYAPYWTYGYYGIGAWAYPWAPDMGYYSTYYPYMRSVRLPTQSMLSKGIPEGVIAPGGYVEGFLYFKKVSANLTEIQFTATLQGAKTGQQFGSIKIPFEVKSTLG
jgi:hypothetical protein